MDGGSRIADDGADHGMLPAFAFRARTRERSALTGSGSRYRIFIAQFAKPPWGGFPCAIVKTAALGLSIAGFVLGTAGAAFACPMGYNCPVGETEAVEQTVVTNTTPTGTTDATKKKKQ